ncbi:hypothetical protein E0H80_16425 [Acinetobacter sp. ANC 4779]|uniref:hypothetical protein n=1 Tax=Acinetobacter sp. ANC 4779 TaxID=2529848 RepID=UPI00103A86A3|nr:hypothetical protein [Acinetobacter sp. ANC 4779]TCB47050.1 hypothetical protein E0H80_16425 [Acinetobacter sp. ANC 4779]
MKKDRYILFQNKTEAEDFIRELDQILIEHWGDAIVHPFNGKAIVPWNDEHLKKVSYLLHGKKKISPEQATEQGWYFGYHQGFFAKATTKLEDATFAREALDKFDTYPNYPAYRATFYGVLVSLFGVKEALWEATKRINDEALKNGTDSINTKANEWWSNKFEEISKDQLLNLFIELHNQDKHNLKIKHLRPQMRLYGYKGDGPAPDIISGEGVFSIVNRGTKDERRIFYSGAITEFFCYLDISPLIHKGEDVSKLSLKQQMDLVIEYYRDLIWEAKSTFK